MDAAVRDIPIAKIDRASRFQIRQHGADDDDPTLASLKRSLASPEGLIHPIVVVALGEPTVSGRTYELITGHRRLRAALAQQWEQITARVYPPCDLTDAGTRLQFLAIAVRENEEREGLRPAERREALWRLKELYELVHPPASSRPAPGHTGQPPAPAFTTWAAEATSIPRRTIQRDLQRALLARKPTKPQPQEQQVAGVVKTPVTHPASPSASAEANGQLQSLIDAGNTFTATCEHLRATWSDQLTTTRCDLDEIRAMLEALQRAAAALLAELPVGESL